jgi:hypothetical protein
MIPKAEKIETLEDLEKACIDKRSTVYVDRYGKWGTPIPAAVIFRMPAIVVLAKFRRGLWLYQKGEKWKPFKTKKGEKIMIEEKTKEAIDAMSQFSMASLWRNAPSGHPYFKGETGEYFKKVFFDEKGGFTPEISKEIG